MTAHKAIENALLSLFKTAFASTEPPVALRPFTGDVDTESAEPEEVEYPAIQFAADPFRPEGAGSSIGYVTVRIESRTQVDDDGDRQIMEAHFETATDEITAAKIGPLVMSPWLVCGIDDAQDGGISVDANTMTQAIGRTYRIALARIS